MVKKRETIKFSELPIWIKENINYEIDKEILKVKDETRKLKINHKIIKKKTSKDKDMQAFHKETENIIKATKLPKKMIYQELRKYFLNYNQTLKNFNVNASKNYPYLKAFYKKELKEIIKDIDKINVSMTKAHNALESKKLYLVEDIQEEIKNIRAIMNKPKNKKELDNLIQKRKITLKKERGKLQKINDIKTSRDFINHESKLIEINDLAAKKIKLIKKKKLNKKETHYLKQINKEIKKLEKEIKNSKFEQIMKKHLKEFDNITQKLTKIDKDIYKLQSKKAKKGIDKIENALSKLGHKVKIDYASMDLQI